MSVTESTRNPSDVGAFLPPRVREELVQVAERNHRSLSGEIQYALSRHLQHGDPCNSGDNDSYGLAESDLSCRRPVG